MQIPRNNANNPLQNRNALEKVERTSSFHPIPTLKNSAIGWFIYDKNKTAKEARDYEKIKYEGLKKRGYQILTVWDYEAKKDFDVLVEKCIYFLTT